MKALTRYLDCSHCDDVVPHKVYFIKRYESFKKKADEDGIKESRVVYQKYCCTCQTNDELDIPDKQWVWLLKNKDWEA